MESAAAFDISQLPSLVLIRIISHSDPCIWTQLGNARIGKLVATTSFRCAWVCQLANRSKIPVPVASVNDIIDISRSVLQPVSDMYGSDAWLTDEFVRALAANRPRLLDVLAPALLWSSLLAGRRSTATVVVQSVAGFELTMLECQVIRELLVRQPSLWMLEWLEQNGVDFSELYRGDRCFDMSLLTGWVLGSRTDLLGFLVQHDLHLPVRSLVDYALGVSTPETVEFLVTHGSGHRNALSWSDMLLMACTEASTRIDVFKMIVSKTEPSIVWTFAASCLASHAMLDDGAYKKFSILRSHPEATAWIIRSVRGRTPIQQLCERLTYENITYLSPFIRDYIDLGVSTADMPGILAMLCQ
ncbi:hypothetical protein GGI15_001118 [Coemansia interrupta]|uniref:Uncharacterized protein n=1 Tax=Coemansia interrupta TaxID=1126814 RepID=A0A9W8HPV9_9FUNG|nr:hypothetical protein GGI15_001118 [Coemansia interrupta]